MKFLLIFVSLIVASLSYQPGVNWISIRAQCQIDTQLSDQSLAEELLGQDVKDPKLGEHAICMLKNVGSMNKDGELELDHIKEVTAKVFGSKGPKVVEECAVKKSSPAETALHMTRCWRRYRSTS